MSAKKIILKESYEQYRRLAEKNKKAEIIVKKDEEKNILLAVEVRKEVKA